MLTLYLFVAAALTVVLARLPLPTLDKLAVGLLLLACAAREADLHVALFEVSILKASFYHRHAAPSQIAVALTILVPVALALLLLLKRHGSLWLGAPGRWRAPVVTVATFFALMVLTKVFDRLPALLVEMRIVEAMPAAARNVLLALEEVLELALPVLAMLAVLQGRQDRPVSRGG